MEEKKENLAELSDEKLDEVNGGCWFWGVFGKHNGSVVQSFIINRSDGSTDVYGKYKCKDCGLIFYKLRNAQHGTNEDITEEEFLRVQAVADRL